MRGVSNTLVVIACLFLLAMQLGGLHLHVDADGNDAGIHAVHLHQVGPEDQNHHDEVGEVHDHSVEVDVSLLEELNASWTNLIPLLMVCVIAAFLGLRPQRLLRLALRHPHKTRHREHWRPPLRAPPTSL